VTRPDDLARLIARVEAATGPSYALDGDISRVAGLPPERVPKAYSASLDAAMTLVPAGKYWSLMRDGLRDRYLALVDGFSAAAATPALALCAASLRARLTKEKNDER
jgi:hypothetical protein